MYKWLLNYHPDNYHPDNYYPGYDAVAVIPGGSGMHKPRYIIPDFDRLREEEELIMIMAGWLWRN